MITFAMLAYFSMQTTLADKPCPQSDCDCGQCKMPGSDDCIDRPTDGHPGKNTGGSCHFFGCSSSRGDAVKCEDHQCICEDGYFADRSATRKCVADTALPCWSDAESCNLIATKCSGCDMSSDLSDFESDVVVWREDLHDVEDSMDVYSKKIAQNDENPDDYPCAQCVMDHSLEDHMKACAGCLGACADDDASSDEVSVSVNETLSTRSADLSDKLVSKLVSKLVDKLNQKLDLSDLDHTTLDKAHPDTSPMRRA